MVFHMSYQLISFGDFRIDFFIRVSTSFDLISCEKTKPINRELKSIKKHNDFRVLIDYLFTFVPFNEPMA